MIKRLWRRRCRNGSFPPPFYDLPASLWEPANERGEELQETTRRRRGGGDGFLDVGGIDAPEFMLSPAAKSSTPSLPQVVVGFTLRLSATRSPFFALTCATVSCPTYRSPCVVLVAEVTPACGVIGMLRRTRLDRRSALTPLLTRRGPSARKGSAMEAAGVLVADGCAIAG